VTKANLTSIVVEMNVNGGTVTVGRLGTQYVVLMADPDGAVISRGTKVVDSYKDAAFHALMHAEWLAATTV